MSALHLDINGPVAELRLDNPAKLNALSISMLNELDDHCAQLEQEDGVRVVLLSAQGDRAFCVGADIDAWADLPAARFARNWVREGHRIFDRLARLFQPTIALVNGFAFGGGLELAAACDIRILAPHASFALPEPSIGIAPGWSGTQRLQRLLPEPVIREMALFGHRLGAKRACQLGFAAQISNDPRTAAQERVEAVLKQSPRALEISKYMLNAGAGEDSAALIEALGGGMIAASNDKHEGVNAFKQKRKPEFPGT
ncbi:Enoyl-CoA hydratase / Delta(3)-cis-delta(2)-trans-enoyl-CoA isomerase / 3-hydroxyacyl-CoA dehydrogenase / 3-hydroxybutyryl-CoA epimerase [hydrothermal vent metagenome]|uniref:Enoyl-CoA hydratase / Delta(3)-cis-delta(2)-trans-enoyl-CoA isomerase / 3-hydroxyacyl-CoA dehydrogenase / 3-hydroxybutyryl-CoA epimerase n=1 Tax=hydrothermal vent metagenome TaxID=652676 RepID=A0A3B0TW25_9ZZZZ